jgi:chemotaxis protein methyltransferase WspC
MVMALLDEGLAAERIEVHGVDVSHRVLAHARHGVYGKSSFRGADPSWRSRYFERTAAGERICDRVRRRVTYQQGNLLRRESLAGTAPYDVIFCRNVLIYFDRPSQDVAVDVLRGLLAPDGVLFVGAAEASLLAQRGFVQARIPNSTAFRKAESASLPRQPRRPRPAAVVPPVRRAPAPRAPAPRAAERTAAVASPDTGVEAALRLADQNRFPEAAAWCEDHLRRHPPSAPVFHLLGLVRDAEGDHSAAAVYYRKALYLNPRHHEALVHLALLMETQHNGAEAELLRRRARRVADETRTS